MAKSDNETGFAFVPIVWQIIRHCFSFKLRVFIQPVVGTGTMAFVQRLNVCILPPFKLLGYMCFIVCSRVFHYSMWCKYLWFVCQILNSKSAKRKKGKCDHCKLGLWIGFMGQGLCHQITDRVERPHSSVGQKEFKESIAKSVDVIKWPNCRAFDTCWHLIYSIRSESRMLHFSIRNALTFNEYSRVIINVKRGEFTWQPLRWSVSDCDCDSRFNYQSYI